MSVEPAVSAEPGNASLTEIVEQMPPPVFALLDGGHFDDLPTQLARKWVFARSLFLGQGDRDVERFGPWLIAIVKPAVVGIVLGVVGDLPAIVFWSCPTGETEICGG